MNAYQAYRQTQAQTATPGELIVMLYQGAARFIVRGIEGIESDNVEVAHTYLVKAQAVIAELQSSLDVDGGGEWARQRCARENRRGERGRVAEELSPQW